MLAALVTVAALFALAVVIAVGPNGPLRLWLDDGGSTVTLEARESTTGAAALPGGPSGLLPGASADGSGTGVNLSSPVTAADRPGAVQLRANTRVQRRAAARTPATSRPRTPAPANTPSPSQPVSQTAPTTQRPVATPAPASSVGKTRGRGTAPAKTDVPKQRVNRQTASPAPTAQPTTGDTPGPTPRSAPTAAPAPASAPATQMRPVHGGGQPSTGVGADDGVLHRVPPIHP